jgi:RNA polymerase sigma-70 factor (ECF subfamily)
MPYRDLSATELVRACVDSADPGAWKEFVSRFQPTIAGVALRTARRWGETSPLVIEDLVQETFMKLCANRCRLLREFEPRHPEAFYGYLKVLTTRGVHDYFKRRNTVKRGLAETMPTGDAPAAEAADPSATDQIERQALIGEIERCLARLNLGPSSDRDRRIFRLYFRTGLSARAIAELPGSGLSTKGVESTIFRITRLLRAKLAGNGPENAGPGEANRERSREDKAAGKGIAAKDRSD